MLRGVGVHHAGVLPKYKRAVEELFQRRLLSVVVCTETLAAGMNLPARSVVLTTLLKGPPGKKKVADASGAHQMFGRAGRPQYDDQGHVYALGPRGRREDRPLGRAKHDLASLENSPDPNLRKMFKRLKKKRPSRNPKTQYWNDDQFQKLIARPARQAGQQAAGCRGGMLGLPARNAAPRWRRCDPSSANGSWTRAAWRGS